MGANENHEQFMKSLGSYLDGFYGPCDSSAECQSPIEAMLYQAISIVGAINMDGVTLQINAQAKLGEYRVDFLIHAYEMCIRCSSKFLRSVVVECDGHDFHEKTKGQASRDKKQDRDLQRLGYNVLRFSGSDIWKDVFSCASEVIEFLAEGLEEQNIEHWKAANHSN